MRYSALVSILVTLFLMPSLFAGWGNEVAIRSNIGMPCSEHEDCGASLHCINEKETKNGAPFIAGYCVKFDCSLSDPCESGSVCVEPEGANFSLCLARCSNDHHCRNGYSCHEEGVCLPQK